MAAVRERELTWDERKEFRVYAAQGLTALGFTNREVEPDEVAQAIGDFIDRWRIEHSKPLARFLRRGVSVDVGISLGFAWGNALARAQGWEWVGLHDGRQELFALVSKDRAYVVYPTYWLREILADPKKENDSLTLYNTLRTGNLPPAAENSYLPLG